MNYLLLRDGVQQGPYTWLQLQEMLGQGLAAGTDPVRAEGSEEWTTLAALAQSAGAQEPATESASTPALPSVYAYSRQGAEPADGPPSYRLFDHTAVAVATIFGSPIAGCALVAFNYRRLGMPGSAVKSVLCGVVGMAIGAVLSSLLRGGSSTWIAIGMIVLTSNLARMYQEVHIVEHKRRGGKLASRWLAFFIGLGVCAVIVALAFAWIVAQTILMPDLAGTAD